MFFSTRKRTEDISGGNVFPPKFMTNHFEQGSPVKIEDGNFRPAFLQDLVMVAVGIIYSLGNYTMMRSGEFNARSAWSGVNISNAPRPEMHRVTTTDIVQVSSL